MKFERYQHIEKFGSVATEGILEGRVHIFPKLDGTNTSVYLNDNGKIEVASRNRVLSPVDDNQGACNYVLSQRKFEEFFAKYPNHRLFGEWLVPHQIRNYEDDAWCKLYIFDVMDSDGYYLPYYNYICCLKEFGIEYIPRIGEFLQNPTEETVCGYLNECNFLMKDGALGEGIVIKNYRFVNRFGHKIWAKIVRPIAKTAVKMHKPITGAEVEMEIVEKFLTAELVEKEFSKIVNDNGGVFQRKLIPKLLGVVWYTLITEEMFNILRKFRNPKIDFALMNKLTLNG